MFARSPLYTLQKNANAFFINYEEFLYELPAHYGSPELEFTALNNSCVCIDFSYYGTLKITGKHALDFLNRMSTNDLKKLNDHEFTLTVLTNDKGRIIDAAVVSRLGDHLRLTTSPQNETNISKWLEKYIIMDDVKIEMISDRTIQLGLIGPGSKEIIASLMKTDPPEDNQIMTFDYNSYTIQTMRSTQLDNGFILTADSKAGESLWKYFSDRNISFCGIDVYHAARIEQKKPILRKELSEKYNPLEAGQTNAVSFTKGCYIGQEVIARLDSYQKIQRHLIRLKTIEPVFAGSKITKDNSEIGIITSSAYSYNLNQYIALGYVKTEFISFNGTLQIHSQNKLITAEFYP